MAISATCVWEARTTGSNTNGGGYTSGGVDKSQQDAAGWALTLCTSAGAGNTVLNASAHADMIGNVGCCWAHTSGFTINEFFEVLSVVAGVSITFGTSHTAASICTAAGVNGSINIGGAFKIGGTLDDEWFDSVTAGNTVYVASTVGGVTYTPAENMIAAVSGTALLPKTFEAYLDVRGTKPTGADRPTIAHTTYTFVSSDYCIWKYFNFTATTQIGFQSGQYNVIIECKSTAGGGISAFDGGSAVIYISCEGISATGTAIALPGYSQAMNCYLHDSSIGIDMSAVTYSSVLHSIIDTCKTGIKTTSATASILVNNTTYNCITGISGTTSYHMSFINNIITGCITGASWTSNELINFWNFNCWYNPEGSDVSNVTKGPNDITNDPLLTSGLVTGTDGATSASGLVFTAAASAPFSGVTINDCLLIKVTGSGATLGVYTISSVDSTSQITLATSAGASKTGITYGIVKGANFTLQALSPCFNTGMKPSSLIGLS